MIDVKSDLKGAKLNKNKKIIPIPAPRKNRMGIVYKDKPPKKKVPISFGYIVKRSFKWKDFLVWNLLPIILGSILGWELTGFIIHIK